LTLADVEEDGSAELTGYCAWFEAKDNQTLLSAQRVHERFDPTFAAACQSHVCVLSLFKRRTGFENAKPCFRLAPSITGPASLDDLICLRKQAWRDRDAKRFCDCLIDYEFNLG
jgi:hypothetical protein